MYTGCFERVRTGYKHFTYRNSMTVSRIEDCAVECKNMINCETFSFRHTSILPSSSSSQGCVFTIFCQTMQDVNLNHRSFLKNSVKLLKGNAVPVYTKQFQIHKAQNFHSQNQNGNKNLELSNSHVKTYNLHQVKSINSLVLKL